MGTRETDQPPLWIATSDLPTSPGHPFYARLTTLLDGHHFEGLCDRFYAPVMGRPSLAPGRYFRLLLVGYFEGIDSERGIAWRATDSLAVRSFLRLAVDEAPPDHSTIARTRRLIDLETHRTVFTWVQQRLVEAGRLTGPSRLTPRRSRRTRRCAASSAGTPARATKRFWRVSRRPRGSRRPRARVWRDWIGSGRRRPRTQTGRTPTIPMRRSRR